MNYPRTSYEMTEADLKQILNACKPVTYMVIGGHEPSSPQENANRAWGELGRRMGFDAMTVRPDSRGSRFFSAVPSETPEQQKERQVRETEGNRLKQIETLRSEIIERQARLDKLTQ